MGRALWLADVLADAFRGVRGYSVEVWPGWTSLGKPTFEPIGTLDHHTGGGGTYDNILRYMLVASSIAPSCNWATSPPINGVVRVTVCCAGRANHAGKGGEGRGGTPWIPTDLGNLHLIGGEHHNNGAAPWPAQQYEGVVIGSAAMLEHLGRSAGHAELHKSYAPGRKVDMHTITHAGHQRAIAARMFAPPGIPTAPRSQEDPKMYAELIRAAYRRTRHNEGDKQNGRLPGGYVSTYDVELQDPVGWRHWLESLAAADVQKGTAAAKLDVVRTCEALLAREAGV